MSDLSISQMLERARLKASNNGLPIRRKDKSLYLLLADCLAICEEVLLNSKMKELREAINKSPEVDFQQSSGRNRKYVEKQSDVYIIVARAVLEGIDNRNSTYRYAATLREAANRQISSAEFADWLERNGGVRALYPAVGLSKIDEETARERLKFAETLIFYLLRREDQEAIYQAKEYLKNHRPDLSQRID